MLPNRRSTRLTATRRDNSIAGGEIDPPAVSEFLQPQSPAGVAIELSGSQRSGRRGLVCRDLPPDRARRL